MKKHQLPPEITLSVSIEPEDPEWDRFLENNSFGHFQQSSMWGYYKQGDGWDPIRFRLVKPSGDIVGGFQILIKKTRFGNIGYVPKGPVLLDSIALNHNLLVDLLNECMSTHKLFGIVVQPHDQSSGSWKAALDEHHFFRSNIVSLPGATLEIPLDPDWKTRMSASARRNIRLALKRGVTIKSGAESDLPVFFELMKSSCHRQGAVAPNPSSAPKLSRLWEAFQGNRHLRLSFAQRQNDLLAGKLCINFGNRCTLWKKGWASTGGELKPNDFLENDAISWASENGYSICDFAGLDKKFAQHLLDGSPDSENYSAPRDSYNLRFGGVPRLLPEAMIITRFKLLNSVLKMANKYNFLNRFQIAP